MGKTPERVVQLLQKEIPGKISRNKFCIQTGINQNSIDKYMAGITEPTTASLQKLSDYFRVSVEWLRGDGAEIAAAMAVRRAIGQEIYRLHGEVKAGIWSRVEDMTEAEADRLEDVLKKDFPYSPPE